MGNLSKLSLHFLFLLLNLLIKLTSSQIKIGSPSNNHVALFIFGDSLFDAGNNNYLKNAGKANFFPYGETFFHPPTGRFSDGRLIPDFIADYLNLPLIEPYLRPGNRNYTNGVNFASGGAGALLETFPGKTIDLKTQVNYFKKVRKQLKQRLGSNATSTLLSNAIFLFSIGINDYSRRFSTNSSFIPFYSKQDYVKMVIHNVSAVLQEIHKNGGRKFVIANVAPLGCLPNMRAQNHGGCMNEVSGLVKMHNYELDILLQSLEHQLQDFQYVYFNLYDSLIQRINYPSTYGFKEVKAACCGVGPYRGMGNCGRKGVYELCEDPNKYLFFDGHPTQKANYQLAQLLWSGKNKRFIRPYNLQHLSQVELKMFMK
ncbi:GDSL esterase/lipase 1-like [Euphorbia lathyris]|uniref:GDSL esterase/lipase 1-like n=1 Tax=Euphorbia lathyris TaxID=212925 RepID=UPI0033142F69